MDQITAAQVGYDLESGSLNQDCFAVAAAQDKIQATFPAFGTGKYCITMNQAGILRYWLRGVNTGGPYNDPL